MTLPVPPTPPLGAVTWPPCRSRSPRTPSGSPRTSCRSEERSTGATRSSANFAQIPNYWTSFSVEPEEFIDAGDYVVVRGTQRAGNDKGSFEAPFVHLLKYENGKTVRGEFFTDSAKAAKLLA